MALWQFCAAILFLLRFLPTIQPFYLSAYRKQLDLSLHRSYSTREPFLILRVTIPRQRATEGSIQALIHICKSAHVRAEMQH